MRECPTECDSCTYSSDEKKIKCWNCGIDYYETNKNRYLLVYSVLGMNMIISTGVQSVPRRCKRICLKRDSFLLLQIEPRIVVLKTPYAMVRLSLLLIVFSTLLLLWKKSWNSINQRASNFCFWRENIFWLWMKTWELWKCHIILMGTTLWTTRIQTINGRFCCSNSLKMSISTYFWRKVSC